MIKYLIVLAVLVMTATAQQEELPFSETASVNDSIDHYAADIVVPVYVHAGGTYRDGEHRTQVEIIPQVWADASDGKATRVVFYKILVTLKMSDPEGKITEFASYLNCTRADCTDSGSEFLLFWDHAGEEKADKAGEIFDEQNSIVVSDKYCMVTLTLLHFLANPYDPWEECGEACTSDANCTLPIRAITTRITIDYVDSYSRVEKSLQQALAEAAEGDELADKGALEDALEKYEKAEVLFEQLDDRLRGEDLRMKTNEIRSSLAEQYISRGNQLFEQGNYREAAIEYEKAQQICQHLDDTEMVENLENLIEKCRLYLEAIAEYDEGMELLSEARDVATSEESLSKYHEAREVFESAFNSFMRLEDRERAEKCRSWIDLCDKRIESATDVGDGGMQGHSGNYGIMVLLLGGVLIAAAVGAVWLKTGAKVTRAPREEETEIDQLHNLKLKLAKGEITTEEYEQTRKILKGE